MQQKTRSLILGEKGAMLLSIRDLACSEVAQVFQNGIALGCIDKY